jgi:hypothetical protein
VYETCAMKLGIRGDLPRDGVWCVIRRWSCAIAGGMPRVEVGCTPVDQDRAGTTTATIEGFLMLFLAGFRTRCTQRFWA